MNRRIMSTAIWYLVFAAALTLLLLGCGTSAPAPGASPSPSSKSEPSQAAKPSGAPASSPAAAAEDAEWQKVVEAAKKEGKFVVYGPLSDDEIRARTQAFTKMYPGIQPEFVNLRGAEAMAKVLAEQAAGKNMSDLIYGGGPTAREMAKNGLTVDFTPPETKKPGIQWLVDPLVDSKEMGGDRNLLTQISIFYVVLNTNLIKPADEPKSFKDLADPRYKGKIAFDDPRMDGPGNRAFSILYKMYGEEWMKQFLSNGLTLVRDYYGDPKRVAQGEYQILVMSNTAMVEPVLGQGLPIKLLIPDEGGPLLSNHQAILKTAPHPNAAKVFQNFMLTKEGQTAVAEASGSPIRGDVPAKKPEFELKGKKAFPGTPTDYATETTYFKEMVQKAKAMIGE